MSTLVTMTLDDVRSTPLTDDELQIIARASENALAGRTKYDPDCPVLTKKELSEFRPWYEAHQNRVRYQDETADMLELEAACEG